MTSPSINGVGSDDAMALPQKGWRHYLSFSTDHKVIGIQYLLTTFFFFLVAGLLAMLIRAELLTPQSDLVDRSVYNGLMTIHGTIMIFLWTIPCLAGLANYLVPLMIGARDMAFPLLNAIAFWIIPPPGLLLLSSFFLPSGMAQAGWWSYPPVSIQNPAGHLINSESIWIVSAVLIGVSSIMGGLNFVTTIMWMRAPGMTFFRMPLFVWTVLSAQLLQLFCLPALTGGLILLFFDLALGTNIFNALQALKNCQTPVELLLGVSVEAVGHDCLRYRTKDQDQNAQEIGLSTTIWATGTATNPLLESLSLPSDSVDKYKHPLVTSTLLLLHFPEVFAAGDCAAIPSHPLPQLAQVAYQQGVGIADNIMALSDGKPPQPVQAKLRGTLMKLGIHKSVANLFDKIQINGEAGYLIRNAAYLEMLPLPAHNFKVTKEWITDEIFDRYASAQPIASGQAQQLHSSQSSQSRTPSRAVLWGGVALATILGIGLAFVWRSQQPYPSTSPTSQPANSK